MEYNSMYSQKPLVNKKLQRIEVVVRKYQKQRKAKNATNSSHHFNLSVRFQRLLPFLPMEIRPKFLRVLRHKFQKIFQQITKN